MKNNYSYFLKFTPTFCNLLLLFGVTIKESIKKVGVLLLLLMLTPTVTPTYKTLIINVLSK